MKNVLVMSVVAVAALVFSSVNADAQWGRSSHSSHGFSSHGSHSSHFGPSIARGYPSNFNRGGIQLSVGFGSPVFTPYNYSARSYGYSAPRQVFHDTTHLDYHGPSLVPHGNHYDVIPGHYDVHRTGHYDVRGRH